MDILAHKNLVRASCFLGPEGAVPNWIHITPATYVVARDGREFDFSGLQEIVAATQLPLLLDVDHQSEMPEGSTAAAGWLVELAISVGSDRAAGLWARVEWTPMGTDLVGTKTFRYLSPTFYLDSKTKKVTSLISVALTNTPALTMTPLDYQRFAARFHIEADEDVSMDEHIKALCTALNVDASADANAIELAAASATQLREQCTKLTTELAAANDRATAAEKKLADMEAASFVASVDACLDQACKDGKVTPAQKDAYRALCAQSPENFELFKTQILPTLKPLVERASKSLDTQVSVDPQIVKLTGLTPEQVRSAQEYNAQHSAAARKE